MKAASPKKETARIQVTPEPKRAMPQATIRMQQTQPLSQAPSAAVRTITPAATTATAEPAAADPLVNILTWAVLAVSLAAAATAYLAYSA